MRYKTTGSRKTRRYVHRQEMEKILGRKLYRFEYVHHRNGDRLDNRPENLQLMTDSEHCSHHHPRSFDVQCLRNLMDLGKTFAQIAALLGKPYSTIQVAARELGFRYLHSHEERRKKRVRNCLNCDKQFLAPDNIRRHNFCCCKCYKAWRWKK